MPRPTGDPSLRLLVVGEGEAAHEVEILLRRVYRRDVRQGRASLLSTETWEDAPRILLESAVEDPSVTVAVATESALTDSAIGEGGEHRFVVLDASCSSGQPALCVGV